MEEGRKAVHWAVVAVPKVSWEAYTMYRKPSWSRSRSYTSEMAADTETMLWPLTSRKKAWLEFSWRRLLVGDKGHDRSEEEETRQRGRRGGERIEKKFRST